MKILFSKPELENLKLTVSSETLKLDEKYLKTRNKYWEKIQNEKNQTTNKIWNGQIYTINKIIQTEVDNPILELGICEYKDIVFSIHYGRENIINDFGSNNLSKYITVDCIPITIDQLLIFGIRNSKTAVSHGSIGLAGGTLNKDEMQVKEFKDLIRFAQKEVLEELKLKTKLNQYKFICLNEFGGKYEFIFKLQLTIHSSEIKSLKNLPEFERLVVLSKKEYLSYKGNKLFAFQYVKNYINQLDIC